MNNIKCDEWKLRKKDLNIFYYRKYLNTNNYSIKVSPIFNYSFVRGPFGIHEWQVEVSNEKIKMFPSAIMAIIWCDLFLSKTKGFEIVKPFVPSCLVDDKEVLVIAKENFLKVGK